MAGRALRIVAVGAMAGAAVFAPHGSAFAADTAVDIQDYSYRAPEVTVSVGDAVTWTNRDGVRHDVKTKKGPAEFASKLLAQGESFTFTFAKAGVYEYFCSPHPNMVAKVIVK
ncbi:MAG: cupredoxin domain-containing protein [Sporichthyaceae bacterium]